jgi:hypothetical protein
MVKKEREIYLTTKLSTHSQSDSGDLSSVSTPNTVFVP